MTPKTIAIGAVLALVLVSASVRAQAAASWAGGITLKEECNSESMYKPGRCSGFIAAIAGIVANEPIYGWRACVPDGVTIGQLTAIVTKYLNDHPEYLHLTATSHAAKAIAIAFPCPK